MALVVLTREAGLNGELRSHVPLGMVVQEIPLTVTTLFAREEVRGSIAKSPEAGTFATIVLTSARATPYVDVAFDYAVTSPELGAVGAVTKKSLEDLGYVVTLTPAVASAKALGEMVTAGPVLFIGAKEPRPELEASVREKGLSFFSAACYETTARLLSATEKATLQEADVILIGAPSAWRVAKECISARTWVLVPGEGTADEIRPDHERVSVAWGSELKHFLEAQYF
jgi:uroporphyrinogen-III synthase